MARKLVIDLDPGIGDALAALLALLDPELDVLALTATPGVVSGVAATRNLQALVAQIDPPKWPRIGTASASTPLIPEELSRSHCFNGPDGLGDFRGCVLELHHPHESSKVLVDTVRAHPHQVTLLTLGPLGNVVAACERAPDFLSLLSDLVCLGGAINAGGDVTAAAEMNMFLNPEAARIVLTSPEAKSLVPLDVTDRVIMTYEQFQRIAEAPTPAAQFAKQLLPYAFRAHHQYLGMEGIWLREVVALAAVARPKLFHLTPFPIDVETRGELTRGMTVVERRRRQHTRASTTAAVEVDSQGVIDYLTSLLR
ncbi:MAG: nucleoside hydrolase [Planctomycetales bacterium]